MIKNCFYSGLFGEGGLYYFNLYKSHSNIFDTDLWTCKKRKLFYLNLFNEIKKTVYIIRSMFF